MSDITQNWTVAKDGTIYNSLWSLPKSFWENFPRTTNVSNVTDGIAKIILTDSNSSISCSTCNSTFLNQKEFKEHCTSEWHVQNIKLTLRGQPSLSLNDFLNLSSNIDKDDNEISIEIDANEDEKDETKSEEVTSDSADSSDSNDDGSLGMPKRLVPWLTLPGRGAFVFSSGFFTRSEVKFRAIEDELFVANHLYNTWSNKKVAVLLIRAGRFAGSIFEGGKPVLHTVITTYAVRRKAGGAQSSHDSSKGNARSAGANLRRAGEAKLQEKVRILLNKDWAAVLSDCSLIFLSSSNTVDNVVYRSNKQSNGISNQQILDATKSSETAASFAPFTRDNNRLRRIPIQIERPTFAECCRVESELSNVHFVSQAALEEAQNEAKRVVEAKREAKKRKNTERQEKIARRIQQQQQLTIKNEGRNENSTAVLAQLSPLHAMCDAGGSLNLLLWTIARCLIDECAVSSIGAAWRWILQRVKVVPYLKASSSQTDSDDNLHDHFDDYLIPWDVYWLQESKKNPELFAIKDEEDDDKDEVADESMYIQKMNDKIASLLNSEIDSYSLPTFSSLPLKSETTPLLATFRKSLFLILNSVDGDIIDHLINNDLRTLSGGKDWRMVRDAEGHTALHVAAASNKPMHVYALLVLAKMDPSLIDLRGRTPFQLATDKNVRDMFRRARALLGEDEKLLGFSWLKAQVPEALDASSEREKAERDKEKKRRARIAKKVRDKQKQAVEKERKVKEEAEAERLKQEIMKGKTCTLCSKVYNGLPIERGGLKYCSTDCSYKHMRELAAAAAEARMKK